MNDELMTSADTRILVKIYDAAENVYQVPESVLPRPKSKFPSSSKDADVEFSLVEKPFSFAITRKESNEVIFDTSDSALIFQSQYLRLRTKLPPKPNLYGLGEHSNSLRLPHSKYIRTLWSRDSFDIPPGTNLYGNISSKISHSVLTLLAGNHPIYFDHRGSIGTHGVFLLNSNGMDIKIDDTDESYLEYNTLGGVFELYFLAGPTPTDVSKQYAEVVQFPATFPYWGLGFHNCRYGYQDWFNVAEVVYNYSKAKIPLETMWTDIGE